MYHKVNIVFPGPASLFLEAGSFGYFSFPLWFHFSLTAIKIHFLWEVTTDSWFINFSVAFWCTHHCAFAYMLPLELVKNPPATQETWVQSWVGKIPMERLPIPVFWPGEFHGLYSPWGCKESNMTKQLSLSTIWICMVLFSFTEYTEELYKKDLHDPDNHDGVITHLEPDILECEVKWALGSITTNKASGRDAIPVELFQILKDDAVKVLHSICSKFGKLSSGHRTGKGQFSFQSKRRVSNAKECSRYSCTCFAY